MEWPPGAFSNGPWRAYSLSNPRQSQWKGMVSTYTKSLFNDLIVAHLPTDVLNRLPVIHQMVVVAPCNSSPLDPLWFQAFFCSYLLSPIVKPSQKYCHFSISSQKVIPQILGPHWIFHTFIFAKNTYYLEIRAAYSPTDFRQTACVFEASFLNGMALSYLYFLHTKA